MNFKTKRRGFGHVLIVIIMVIIFIAGAWFIYSEYQLYSEQHTYDNGIFEGYSPVTSAGNTQYLVRLSGATLTCSSSTMNTSDIYALTHLQVGQDVTMNQLCENIVVVSG